MSLNAGNGAGMSRQVAEKRAERTRAKSSGAAERGRTEPIRAEEGSKPRPGTKAAHRGLLLVATPIGNAEDISLRALRALGEADVIACEDTRLTGTLMARYGITTPLVAYHEHNAARMRPQLLRRLACGETVALVSDAGTPLISDPGYKLVREATQAGLPVTALPGASAVLCGLVLSGLPTDRFFFAGFLAPKSAARRTALGALKTVPASLVFFESPGRLAASLDDMARVLGARPAAVARELTKLFEEVRRGSLGELAAHYAAAGAPRGEVVVVVGPPQDVTGEASDESLEQALGVALQTMSLRDAAAAVAAATGRPRREVYARALALLGDGKKSEKQ
jgi:16S rRNA (cytidine1402-2'-O)-methyltransferase